VPLWLGKKRRIEATRGRGAGCGVRSSSRDGGAPLRVPCPAGSGERPVLVALCPGKNGHVVRRSPSSRPTSAALHDLSFGPSASAGSCARCRWPTLGHGLHPATGLTSRGPGSETAPTTQWRGRRRGWLKPPERHLRPGPAGLVHAEEQHVRRHPRLRGVEENVRGPMASCTAHELGDDEPPAPTMA